MDTDRAPNPEQKTHFSIEGPVKLTKADNTASTLLPLVWGLSMLKTPGS